ncbi:MAG: hypothetical protein EZS28_019499, partial [Streblomastix strix]
MQTTTSRGRGVLKQLKHLMELAKRKKHVRTRDLASVIGEIQCTIAQFKRGTLHIKQLQRLNDKEVARRGWNKWTQLNRSAISDITWWINKWVELRMGGNIDQRESGEGLCAWTVEGQQPQELQSTRSDSSSGSSSRIPSRIDLITAYWNTITHRQHSYNVLPQQAQRINRDRATNRQSPQVSRTIQLDNTPLPRDVVVYIVIALVFHCQPKNST